MHLTHTVSKSVQFIICNFLEIMRVLNTSKSEDGAQTLKLYRKF
jgi:hypothetical protein